MASTLRVYSAFLLVFAAGILGGCDNGSGAASSASASGATGTSGGPTGEADLSWAVPSPSTDAASAELAGYHIYYGTSSTNLTNVVDVGNPSSTSFVIDNLAAGTWYFAIKSYDTNLVESPSSAVVPVQI